MSHSDDDAPSRTTSGLFTSAQRLLDTVLAIVHTRIEIVATEFEEERERIKALVLYAVFALVLISLGIVTLTVFITLWLWETYGVLALGIVGLLFLATGIAIALLAYSRERARPRIFSTTLSEIAKDRATLQPDNEQPH